MQIPILNGVYTDEGPDIRTLYPVNLVPVPKAQGISNGYLRPADGIVQISTGPGIDRGGMNWNGSLYRVMGQSLVLVGSDGAIVELGRIPGAGPVRMDYSFDRLAIAASGGLYYWNGTTLTRVSDPDLGTVVDFCWIAGYFFTTDGQNLVVTELNNPTAVDPLKYGSSESDPDPVLAVLKLRNEVYAINKNTIEVFGNIGGTGFPFQRIEGGQIQKGAVGTRACCIYSDAIAFVGGARNESPAVYVGINAGTTKISTQEIDALLSTYTESELADILVETRNQKANEFLYIHLPDRTLVYDAIVSQAVQENVWFVLTSSTGGFSQFRARNAVWAYNRWFVGDTQSGKLGYYSDLVGEHWGEVVRWEFGTQIIYNESRGAIFHELELVTLSGRVALTANTTVATSYSTDGETWSQEKVISAGNQGDRAKRLVWFGQGAMSTWRIQRFRGDSTAHLSFLRLEAAIEPLGV